MTVESRKEKDNAETRRALRSAEKVLSIQGIEDESEFSVPLVQHGTGLRGAQTRVSVPRKAQERVGVRGGS